MRRLYLSIFITASLILGLSGCNNDQLSPPSLQSEKIDPNLPAIELTQKGLVSDMTEIAFEWKPLANIEVEGIKVYRSEADGKKTYLHATINNRYATHYVDLDVKPNQKFIYSFRTFKGNSISLKAKRIEVYSKPILPSVSWIYARSGLPQMAKILWRPHPSQRVIYYIIERKTIQSNKWEEIAKIKGRLQVEYIDKNLKNRSNYWYRIKVETYDGIVSNPSKVVEVVTRPLPPIVTGIEATQNLPHQIFLKWDKSNYKDFERYYVYRATNKEGHYELVAKLYNNHFTDKIDEDGVQYFYKVAQVDKDGLESNKDGVIVMGSTLGKPLAPTFSSVHFDGSKIFIKWIKVDPRTKSYILEKITKSGLFNTTKSNIKTMRTEYIDTAIVPKSTYTYKVYAVDQNGLISKPSIEATVNVQTVRPSLASQQPIESNGVQQHSQPIQKRTTPKYQQPSDDIQEVVPAEDLDVDVQ